ncbi:MAG: hypothetical protein LBR30_03030 [Clostridioides sp.]|jgi:hypothetical protein|nr:hypothetical protein [Clostridioides sp.]
MNSNIGINEFALAIVTTDKEMNISGGCPVFFVESEEELQKKALLISKCFGGMVHDMTKGTLIVVKH